MGIPSGIVSDTSPYATHKSTSSTSGTSDPLLDLIDRVFYASESAALRAMNSLESIATNDGVPSCLIGTEIGQTWAAIVTAALGKAYGMLHAWSRFEDLLFAPLERRLGLPTSPSARAVFAITPFVELVVLGFARSDHSEPICIFPHPEAMFELRMEKACMLACGLLYGHLVRTLHWDLPRCFNISMHYARQMVCWRMGAQGSLLNLLFLIQGFACFVLMMTSSALAYLKLDTYSLLAVLLPINWLFLYFAYIKSAAVVRHQDAMSRVRSSQELDCGCRDLCRQKTRSVSLAWREETGSLPLAEQVMCSRRREITDSHHEIADLRRKTVDLQTRLGIAAEKEIIYRDRSRGCKAELDWVRLQSARLRGSNILLKCTIKRQQGQIELLEASEKAAQDAQSHRAQPENYSGYHEHIIRTLKVNCDTERAAASERSVTIFSLRKELELAHEHIVNKDKFLGDRNTRVLDLEKDLQTRDEFIVAHEEALTVKAVQIGRLQEDVLNLEKDLQTRDELIVASGRDMRMKAVQIERLQNDVKDRDHHNRTSKSIHHRALEQLRDAEMQRNQFESAFVQTVAQRDLLMEKNGLLKRKYSCIAHAKMETLGVAHAAELSKVYRLAGLTERAYGMAKAQIAKMEAELEGWSNVERDDAGAMEYECLGAVECKNADCFCRRLVPGDGNSTRSQCKPSNDEGNSEPAVDVLEEVGLEHESAIVDSDGELVDFTDCSDDGGVISEDDL